MKSLRELAGMYNICTKTMSKYIKSISDPVLEKLQAKKRIDLITPKEYTTIINHLGEPL